MNPEQYVDEQPENAEPIDGEQLPEDAKQDSKPVDASGDETHAELIKEIKVALNNKGADLDVDTDWGWDDYIALRDFQVGKGLEGTGVIDEDTSKALDI